MVKVTCYGKEMTFKSKKEAIRYFNEGMDFCDPDSSEYERYATIVSKLLSGRNKVTDNYWGD